MRLEFIAFNLIDYNPAINARGDRLTDVSEVEATLKAEDFAQPMLLRPAPAAAGRFEPVDGGRRYHAARNLVAKGEWPDDKPIPALVRDLTDAEAIELSLAAAVTRLDLNPADEAMSFAKLVKAGTTPDDIAARFGVPLRRVKQRLAISSLPEKIVSALRDGTIALDVAQAFTLARDPKQAEKIFDGGNLYASGIRRQLTEKRVGHDSREAEFVGIEAYRAAGGQVEEDLFTAARWLSDGKLLAKLFRDKLESEKQRYLAEGWAFAEVLEEGSKTDPYRFHTLQPEGKPSLTPEQQARVAELKTLTKAMARKMNDADEVSQEDEETYEQLADECETLTANHFTPVQKARSGVLIDARFNYQKVTIRKGLMRPAEARKEAKASKQKTGPSREAAKPSGLTRGDADADFSGALNSEMATAMTKAMQHAIAANPQLAWKAAAALLLTVDSGGGADPFQICTQHRTVRTSDDIAKRMKEHLPKKGYGDFPATFDMIRREASPADIEVALALGVAKLFALGLDVPPELKPLIDAFNPNVADHWQPHEDFFKKLPRESLAAALGEAAIPDVTPSKKKRELVEMAVRHLIPMGWLPKPLRSPCYKGPGSNQWSDAHAAMTADKIAAKATPKPVKAAKSPTTRHSGESRNPASGGKATRAATKRVKAAALRKAAPAKKKPRK